MWCNLREYNHFHDARGRFTTSSGATGGEGAGPSEGRGKGYSRPTPIRVRTVDEAIPLILKGKTVELPDPLQANTLLRKLAGLANEAARLGQDAPNYDLCQVSVKGTNLFCAQAVRTKEFPKGIPRIKMPQFAGKPVPGSAADRLPKNPDGGVNAAEAFIEHLTSLGIRTSRKAVAAARLKGTQRELVGPTVAGMMTNRKFDPAAEPIFVSRDHYVIDGHHRWAAVVGRDLGDGRLGDLKMRVIMVDAPISEVLHTARRWAPRFGLAGKAGNTKLPHPSPVTGRPLNGKRTPAKWPSSGRRRAA